ncbi:thrombospondin type 3 repeat-containing protein [Gynuella sunshinyii]|uniref:GLUG domain-containing protein n=1 Tax=Gynuella sunshinyii YC6258 TaxID=1445510 RepID=A0A0C5VEA3_9GAMM|nr:thrombospondin type 3 repeat-containing protein [Gynuella sunshinyii]AJQ92857.1 hypothetical Protein YC6258_00807 [Gynuella sunshinyii YC6258]
MIKSRISGLFTIPRLLLFTSAFQLAGYGAAAGNRVDYDIDDDGLIEINDLADLNEIRNDMTGRSLYGDNVGCAQNGCRGFELTTSLNFDTNADGVFDEHDEYWNDGFGWVPIGERDQRFRAVFEGNGYSINNLVINRPESSYVGLFGYITDASIHHLSLSGDLTHIAGGGYVGGLVGSSYLSAILAADVQGTVSGQGLYVGGLVGAFSRGSIVQSHSDSTVSSRFHYVGGLIGVGSQETMIRDSYSTGSVTGGYYVGGLIGKCLNTEVLASYSTGSVRGKRQYVGGLIGKAISATSVTASYSTATVHGSGNYVGGLLGDANDLTLTASYSAGTVIGSGEYVGGLSGYAIASTVTGSYWADDSMTVEELLGGSDNVSLSHSQTVTLNELKCPVSANDVICANGVSLYSDWDRYVYTNSQGQLVRYWNFGSVEQLPALVLNGVVHRDTDNDGIWDDIDAFPEDPSESVDTDGDGIGDNADQDIDGDGINNDLDAFPYDATENTDTDHDGIGDNADDDIDGDSILNAEDVDQDNDGLIELYSLDDLDAMRDDLLGRTLSGNGLGCPETGCNGYELMRDLDFDSNRDGVINRLDQYWNDGKGWQPIAQHDSFSATFDGNDHHIDNLYIARSHEDNIGLFGHVKGAHIRHVGLGGELMHVAGRMEVGGLVGYASSDSIVSDSYSAGVVVASDKTNPFNSNHYNTGGLVGTLFSHSQIIRSYGAGSVSGATNVGGLVGQVYADSLVLESYSTAQVEGEIAVGGLVGQSYSDSRLVGSYAMASVNGESNVGGLLGSSFSGNEITGCFAGGQVSGNSSIGGLVGMLDVSGKVTASFSTARVEGRSYGVGGLVGSTSRKGNVISGSYAVGRVQGGYTRGGIAGSVSGDTLLNNYWALDGTGQQTPASGSLASGSVNVGATLNQLRCPESPDNTSCASDTLYSGWADYRYTDASGHEVVIWDFGNANQLPGININGIVYRDSDLDGVLDHNDAFPYDVAESVDHDGDGIGDNADTDDDNDGVEDALDALPLDPAETSDSDHDGIGDNADFYPYDYDNDGLTDETDPYPHDYDNDGVDDELDVFPFDASEWLDSDGDGQGDNADLDDDNDGVADSDDAFPLDSTGTRLEDSVDKNGNGLIEISSLDDLDAMRNSPYGVSLRGVSAGCPLTHCYGFELTDNLDFDSNQDGLLDFNDWNHGLDWSPIGGESDYPFSAVFDGQGYQIRNLHIAGAYVNEAGLFGTIDHATIRHLGLTGDLMSINTPNAYRTGSIAGQARASVMTAVYSSGAITGGTTVGGLVGDSFDTIITASYVSGSVTGSDGVGGVIGVGFNSTIEGSYVTAAITANNAGSLLGSYGGSMAIRNSYWATDTTTQASVAVDEPADISETKGVSLTELKCPVMANGKGCGIETIFVGWDQYTDQDDDGNTVEYWDFGSSEDLPGLLLNGQTFRPVL